MTREENIRAILQCNLPIIQSKVIETIIENIIELEKEDKKTIKDIKADIKDLHESHMINFVNTHVVVDV